MTMTKKEQRKVQHRLEILQAGERIFARQGFYPTTMEEIGEEAGWSKGTLYLYFKSKEDLFFSILTEKMDQFSHDLHTKLAGSSRLEEKIALLVHAHINFFSKNKHFFQLVIAEQGKVMHTSSTGMREKLIQQQHKYIDGITKSLSKDLPSTTSVEADTLARSIIGAVNVHMVTWLLEPEHIDLNNLKSQLTTLFLNGILSDAKL